MTIQDRINQTLKEMEGNPTLYIRASKLNESVEELLEMLIDHLGEIDNQLFEYDKHDKSHSEKVLKNIEELLREKGIAELSFLEALVLRLCCYFHDAGMILPQCYVPLMEKVETNPSVNPEEGLNAWLTEKKKGYADIKGQFYCPDTEAGFEDFLIDQLEEYQKYCMGLPQNSEVSSKEDYFREKRHEYLRITHGARARVYSQNLSARFSNGLSGSGREDLKKAVGDICASHCWEIGEVRKLTTKLELQNSCPEMTCNVRYLAMLLRLGDVLHFSSDRVSDTVYAERDPMGAISDRHWRVKLGDLSYTISTSAKNRKITFDGSFEDPKSYYFLQDHLNRMDEELKNYAFFVSDMHGELDSARYVLGLPTEVDRERVRAIGFKPDQDLKFKLEHQKIITLLMGMRLYRDEFMCLRELYQNALDACRCMRAENETKGLHGELEIEFGMGTDDGGDFLYCKDQGTGMTIDIVKNYLLRIGNSYYQSPEFRRANASWGGKVSPVSEFGIGLLSCYMIASRIEVITRHYTKAEDDTIWISMECSDDYGYFKTPSRREKRWLDNHGTIVKLYLMDEYKDKVMDYIPDNPKDVVFILKHCKKNKEEKSLYNSLYGRIHGFVHIPEVGIRLFVKGAKQRLQIPRLDECYDLSKKLPMLVSEGVEIADIIGHHIPDSRTLLGKKVNNGDMPGFVDDFIKWRNYFRYYSCVAEDDETHVEALSLIHLPVDPDVNYGTDLIGAMDYSAFGNAEGFFIDGMPVSLKDKYEHKEYTGIIYRFLGDLRPNLTVDRGEIRTIPDRVKELLKELNVKLQNVMITKIREHFSNYPNALTNSAKDYVVKYLFEKYEKSFAVGVLKELSYDLLKDYMYYGASLCDWLNNSEVETTTAFLLEDEFYGAHQLAHDVIMSASKIQIKNDRLLIEKNVTQMNLCLEQFAGFYQLGSYVIKSDNWPEMYLQYDVVRNYAGLVPTHTFNLIHDSEFEDYRYESEELGASAEGVIADKHKRMRQTEWMLPCAIRMRDMDPVYMRALKWEDVIFMLKEDTGTNKIRQAYNLMNFVENGKARYVLYVFINPRLLSEDDKAYVSQYDNIPKYRECVEKGWSILFYNYKNGYVIAPGIVDRMEMLKLLPQEVLEHDDGLEYYFTDGTHAF